MAIDLKAFEEVTKVESEIKKESTSWTFEELLQKDIQLFGGGLSLKKKEALFSELNVLLVAGLDIQRSFEIIKGNRKKDTDKKLIERIQDSIVNGSAFSEALIATKKFSEYEVYSIQIGEESGQLAEVLAELGNFYKKSIKYRQQFLGALAYPGFVISFAYLVVFFLLKYLVPMFSDIYNRFDGELPLLTRKLISCSAWMENYAVYLFLVILSIVVGLFLNREKIWFKRWSAFILLRLPLFGDIISKVYLARFSQSMFLLLSARVPLLRAVELIEKMIDFYPISEALKVAKKDILQGELLNTTLSKSTFFPSSFIALLQVGEEASNLDLMFKKLSQQNSEVVEQKTALIGSLLEPVLIISLGAIVGVILVAMYMPLFQMSSGVGG